MIKAVIFDYGGVIAKDILNELASEISRKFDLDFEQTKEKLKYFFKELQEKGLEEENSLRILSDLLKVDFLELKNSWLKVVKSPDRIICEVVGIIRSLKKENYKIALLSNALPYATYDEEIRKLFDVIVISSEVKIRKPNHQVYKLTLEKLGVNPEEAIFIDNREFNLIPAQDLGINTILFQNPTQLKKDLQKILRGS